MLPNFNDLIKAAIMAGVVVGAAIGLGARAEAGTMDQGPHILVGYGFAGVFTPIAAFENREMCLAFRDDLYRQLAAFSSDRASRAFLACVPGRST